jgi:DNA-binding transcriptional regulator PaaX
MNDDKNRLSRNRSLGKATLALAEGIFEHTVDFGLWLTIYITEAMIPQSVTGQNWRAVVAADEFLRDINYEVVKNAIQTARKRGWVRVVKRNALPEITKEGRRRLESKVPQYDRQRIWDGRMHIVTYDIPEEHKHDRELLRRYLRTIRCGRLQDSVWVTPYNPIDLVRTFVKSRDLHGTIIVSDMGKDGSIGEEDLKELVTRVYGLEKLSDRYGIWITQVDQLGFASAASLLGFLAILKDDSQLPFALLPEWWKGDTAYKLAKENLVKVVNKKAIA